MDHGRVNPEFRLEDQGISGLAAVHYNLTEPDLVAHALKRGEGDLGIGGALLVNTGKFTGRSPKDKHVVVSATTEGVIWWDANARMDAAAFDVLRTDMYAHMAGKDYYVQDLYGGADPVYRIGVRVVSELAWHNLFIRHMLLRPERDQLDDFTADFTIVNCPSFSADPRTSRVPQRNGRLRSTSTKRLILIGGTNMRAKTRSRSLRC